MAHCCSWCPCRPSLTLFAMFLLAAETCILIIMIHSAFETFGKKHILEVTFFRKRYAQVSVLLYAFFAGILLLIDVSTLILVASGKYGLSKSFILHTAIFQALLNLPFGISGIYLCTQMSSASVYLFGGSWIDAFLLIRQRSMELTPPQRDVSKENIDHLESASPDSPDYATLAASEHTSNFGEMLKHDEREENLADVNVTIISDIPRSVMSKDVASIDVTKEVNPQNMGIRDITQNHEVLFALDKAFSTVASVQTTLRCCGLESSEDWLNHFSGNFTIVEPSRYKVWWMNTSRPSRFPLSCCSWDALCATKISVWHSVSAVPPRQEITGCRTMVVRQLTTRLKLMSALLVGISLYHVILAMLNYFLIERKRRVARCLYVRSWQSQLQVTLQQQKRKTMLAALSIKDVAE